MSTKNRKHGFSRERRVNSLRPLQVFIVVSVLVNLLVSLWLTKQYQAYKNNATSNQEHTYQVTLNPQRVKKPQKEAVDTISEPESKPAVEHQAEPVPEPIPEPPSELEPLQQEQLVEEQHNPFHNANQNASTNTTVKEQSNLVSGKPFATEDYQASEASPANEVSKVEEVHSPLKHAGNDGAKSVSETETKVSRSDSFVDEDVANGTIDSTEIDVNPTDANSAEVLTTTNQASWRIDKNVNEEKIPAASQQKQVSASGRKSNPGSEIEALIRSGRERMDSTPQEFAETAKKPESKLKIPDEFREKMGNMELLDDVSLKETTVMEPYSQLEAKKLQMVNRYLEKMQKQIVARWKKPNKEFPKLRGIIKFQLDKNGYLEDADIFVGSGDVELDVSALDAVRSVIRYAVPENQSIVNRYYRSLKWYFSSHEREIEEMVFVEEIEH
ncbi:energy transducer TonB family protein [Oleiphilus messinensis]|uniref:energy transducer TonB family protein n=1 Tax=Oleiphilus messinensis TaxID=141451 RepID=UPI0018DFC77F|nr:energy transducer TonB [Oleiphilus messinensis]